ncbi:MAG: hypothetical protein COW67_04645 [Flavobacteriales bacterium CG18_big_fil_WC_8_21_14_2_50_32_9]|nr:hypothetical protein [Flavobacteriales bacterium]PIQ16131.1 MAG: hypothetical protein COW67_04645 [Flavobacteriales bacterium CG18_big_fil_WC_8_21_14_2_50_32_9]PJC63105.1 MAG: hypothetical protein CO022_01010 [Flavobacteriales bacterium CG_4_9_14_0_2_um_filter_32_27]
MRINFYIITILFFLFTLTSYGQKKKRAVTNSSTEVTKKRDAFEGKSKKGPNVESDNGAGNSKSKVKQYKHSVSKKNVKRKDMKNQAEFSSKKTRYKTGSKKNKGDSPTKKSRSGRKSAKNGK